MGYELGESKKVVLYEMKFGINVDEKLSVSKQRSTIAHFIEW